MSAPADVVPTKQPKAAVATVPSEPTATVVQLCSELNWHRALGDGHGGTESLVQRQNGIAKFGSDWAHSVARIRNIKRASSG